MTAPTITAPRLLGAGLDIETTGLDQTEGHRIIEIALSVYDLNTAVKVGQFLSRVNPQRGIDPKAQEVHGITFEELAGEPVWEVVAPKVHAILARCKYVVAHNGFGFDVPFVAGELIRAGLPMPEVAVADTMLQGRWATPDGALPNLGALCFACGVEYDKSKAHSALYDVDVMMQCFFRQLPRGFFHLPAEPYRYTVPAPRKEKK
jgi:DNA polymerase-3 subunit epsilon